MKKKIVIALFALLLFFSIGAIVGVVYITQTTSELKGLIELYQVEELRRSLIIKIQTVQSDLHTVNTPFAKQLDSIVESVMALETSSEKCTSCHHRKELADRIIAMQGLMRDYETHLSYFLTTRANAARLHKIKTETVAKGSELIKMTEQMSHSASTSLGDKTDKAMANISHVKTILYATIGATLLLSILVAFRLTRYITRPIKEILSTTRMIAAGKYGSTIAYSDKTEFGELAEHFNTMSTAIKEGYDKIQQEVHERRQTENALRQSEEKFRTFFEMSPTGIIIYPVGTDPLRKKMKNATFNPAFHNFFGYTRKELEDRSIESVTHHDDIQKNIEHSQDLIERKRDTYNMEKRYIRKDGAVVWGYINTTLLFDTSGTPTHIMTILIDINERKKMEEEHLKMQKLESVGILAGGIAHDFNNILTTIMGNVALAKMSPHQSENTYQILDDAEEACQRAKELTAQLLTFAKGGSPIKKVSSITELLKTSARLVLRGTNITCNFKIDDDLWAIEADAGQINQVMFNLIINSIQAMPGGGSITVKAENVSHAEAAALRMNGNAYVRVTVEDHGAGIPEDNLKNIFDPYFTTKKKGSGLGLSSTYAIINKHDGHIDVTSEVGKGTTFTFLLPALEGQVVHEANNRHAVLKGKGKVLLMDDDENILTTVSKTLKQVGYSVASVKDGEKAIETYTAAMNNGDPFNVVIMDLTIREGMGGKEAVQNLLKVDPQARVIVSSGYSTDTVMANYRDYGFCEVITKPYKIESLCDLLSKVITEQT